MPSLEILYEIHKSTRPVAGFYVTCTYDKMLVGGKLQTLYQKLVYNGLCRIYKFIFPGLRLATCNAGVVR